MRLLGQPVQLRTVKPNRHIWLEACTQFYGILRKKWGCLFFKKTVHKSLLNILLNIGMVNKYAHNNFQHYKSL